VGVQRWLRSVPAARCLALYHLNRAVLAWPDRSRSCHPELLCLSVWLVARCCFSLDYCQLLSAAAVVSVFSKSSSAVFCALTTVHLTSAPLTGILDPAQTLGVWGRGSVQLPGGR
jgi:hypothetical protein